MRLIVANPQVHFIGRTLLDALIFRRGYKKYGYFLKYLINDPAKDVAFFIDGTKTSLNGIGIRFPFASKTFSYIELLIWMFLNKVNPLKKKVFFDVKKLEPKKDIIINFSFSTIDDAYTMNHKRFLFHNYSGIVLTHITHYLIGTDKIADYLKKVKNSFLIAESNLTDNIYFRKYFAEVENVYYLPFVYADRFQSKKEFSRRKNKCFAVGTFSKAKFRPFNDYYGERQCLHPMRELIYINSRKGKYEKEIDCFIYTRDDVDDLKKIREGDSFVDRLLRKTMPYFILEKIFPNFLSKYFSFDIVEKYNSYRMFVSPEEVVGLPSINTFEGMACGCAFIGIDDPMHKRLGMKDGEHYISYKDGDLTMLMEKIRYYQAHADELEAIAEGGMYFVRDNFNEKKVAAVFWDDMKSLLDSYNSGNPKFVSSFEKNQIKSYET